MKHPEKIIAIATLPHLSTTHRLQLAALPVTVDEILHLSANSLSRLLEIEIQRTWSPRDSNHWYASLSKWYEQEDHHITYLYDERYPPLLRHISDPPFLLTYEGQLDNDAITLSVVGTRNATDEALAAAYSLGLECASAHTIVVSGGARGIDYATHQGTLAAKGKTYVVLGGGLANLNPRDKYLVKQILAHQGACISEFHPLSSPLPWHFPLRNRIISALSPVTVVIQAPQRSGALITADYALRQGRDVVVHRCGLSVRHGMGTRNLVQDGAPIIDSLADIAEATHIVYPQGRAVIVADTLVDDHYPYRMGTHQFDSRPSVV